MKPHLIALTGPSGVGKNHIKIIARGRREFREPQVITTRAQRPSDGVDRLAGVPLHQFHNDSQSGQILFPHQLFGRDGPWYGFRAVDLEPQTDNVPVLTEIHATLVPVFRQAFRNTLVAIGVIADQEYLLSNLQQRNSENTLEWEERMRSAQSEMELIYQYAQQGLISQLFTVTHENRARIASIVSETIVSYLSQ